MYVGTTSAPALGRANKVQKTRRGKREESKKRRTEDENTGKASSTSGRSGQASYLTVRHGLTSCLGAPRGAYLMHLLRKATTPYTIYHTRYQYTEYRGPSTPAQPAPRRLQVPLVDEWPRPGGRTRDHRHAGKNNKKSRVGGQPTSRYQLQSLLSNPGNAP
ncbi:hypothetical protein KQX54_007346 [Cotesia glomerata]|uniref:Uncharacterized protein n=1 Tax=Cotesia glomerata TaxID=32391 RepID=A0AAV7I3A4_COTGL|nr:hypothetical protein KQX54_007346 [Cotesia glomerata]